MLPRLKFLLAFIFSVCTYEVSLHNFLSPSINRLEWRQVQGEVYDYDTGIYFWNKIDHHINFKYALRSNQLDIQHLLHMLHDILVFLLLSSTSPQSLLKITLLFCFCSRQMSFLQQSIHIVWHEEFYDSAMMH